MKDRYHYLEAMSKNILLCSVRKLIGRDRFTRKRYYGKKIKDNDEANRLIYEALMADKPFLAARFGDAELRTLVYTLDFRYGIRNSFPDYIKKAMHNNAGFFPPTDENLLKFGQILWESAKSVDMYGVWYNLLEDYVIHTQSPDAELVRLEALEPYRSNNPWSKALKGKKVLVVHPFEDSIKEQYAKKEKLFANLDVLPDFELLTYKALQTNAGGICQYDNWFMALDAMYNDIKKLDFDVAIVGCGAYGLPLSARIKELGKQVIHLAGATQMLFGIRGARWDARPDLQHLFNSYWIRPSEKEKPKNASSVENGCYW